LSRCVMAQLCRCLLLLTLSFTGRERCCKCSIRQTCCGQKTLPRFYKF
jgi:hypothetical protein